MIYNYYIIHLLLLSFYNFDSLIVASYGKQQFDTLFVNNFGDLIELNMNDDDDKKLNIMWDDIPSTFKLIQAPMLKIDNQPYSEHKMTSVLKYVFLHITYNV